MIYGPLDEYDLNIDIRFDTFGDKSLEYKKSFSLHCLPHLFTLDIVKLYP